jgi:hypothetical protein
MVMLATKPYQEHVINILKFIWHMCVSYHCLNQVTLPFEYPIPRCNDTINHFEDSSGRLFFISLDNKTGYHQISVRFCDQEKLAFFGPDRLTTLWSGIPTTARPAYIIINNTQ